MITNPHQLVDEYISKTGEEPTPYARKLYELVSVLEIDAYKRGYQDGLHAAKTAKAVQL